MSSKTLQQMLNEADLNRLTDLLGSNRLALGDVLAALGNGLAATLVDEAVTVTSNVGVLAQPACEIFAVYATAGSVTGKVGLIPPSQTVATTQAKLATDGKTITFFATDAVTAARVLYRQQPAALQSLAATLAANAGP